MNKDDWFMTLLVVLAAALFITLFYGLGYVAGYKHGQLDYQANKIEWTIIDGKVHHITEGK